MKRVGIYSGTFDPIHNGHIAFALEAVEQVGLDKVFFMPEKRPRRKQGVKAFEHRIEMTQTAIRDYQQLGVIILEQHKFTPRQTLPVLIERFKGAELYMLIGDDMLDHFIEWPHVEELISAIQFVVGIRKYSVDYIETVAKTVQATTGKKLKYQTFSPSASIISSTMIKQNIKKRSDYSGLDPDVAEYIRETGLYSVGEK